MSFPLRIGTAGWALPATVRDTFPAGASNLARYAGRLDSAEINSSFHRSHRPAVYERWAASVPEDFRFAVKLPKTITHERRLSDCDDLLARFAEEAGGLGGKRGPVLVQLPPSLAFDAATADAFFGALDTIVGGPAVCEPRHPSWFDGAADALLVRHRIARVAADPAPVPEGAAPAGWSGLAYFRLHGSPHIYRSGYEAAARGDWAARMAPFIAAGTECWTIFDNTTLGCATADALALQDELGSGGSG